MAGKEVGIGAKSKIPVSSDAEESLTDTELAHLAPNISSQVMRNFAVKQLGFTEDEVDNVEDVCGTNKERFNRTLLVQWRNKNYSKNNRQELIELFSEASRKDGNIHFPVLYDILKGQGEYCREKEDDQRMTGKLQELQKRIKELEMKEKLPEELHVELLRTKETGMANPHGYTVMSSTCEVALWSVGYADIELHNFEDRKIKTLSDPCKDAYKGLLSMWVEGKEVLAVSCEGCGDINLFHVDTGQMSKAFQSDYPLHHMCHGEDGHIFVHAYGNGGVLYLNCSRPSFVGPIKTIITEISYLDDMKMQMCYLPSPYEALVLNSIDGGKLQSISCGDSKVLWETGGAVGADSAGLFFSQQHHLLLVGCKNSVVVLNPGNGERLQTIKLYNMGKVLSLSLIDDQLIMHHVNESQGKISLLEVRSSKLPPAVDLHRKNCCMQ